MFQIIGTMAEFERSLIQESKGGPAERAREGEAPGTAPHLSACGEGSSDCAPRDSASGAYAARQIYQGYAAAGGETE